MDDYDWINDEPAPSGALAWIAVGVPFAAFWLAVGWMIGRNV